MVICLQDTGDNQQTTVEELLISCVMARPPLWDSRLPIKERSKTIRDQLWLEIFEEFGANPEFSTEYLIKKWRNLRDTYVRLKGEYTPSGSAAKKKKKWEFFDLMTFLNDTINYRATTTNLASGASTSSTPSPMMSPTLSDSESRTDLRQKRPPHKIEGAIIEALNNINNNPLEAPTPINQICMRISEILDQMPQQPRTLLEIKLLQMTYEEAKDFLK